MYLQKLLFLQENQFINLKIFHIIITFQIYTFKFHSVTIAKFGFSLSSFRGGKKHTEFCAISKIYVYLMEIILSYIQFILTHILIVLTKICILVAIVYVISINVLFILLYKKYLCINIKYIIIFLL